MLMLLKDNKGAAVVEFALILPLLLLILLGIIEFGLIFYNKAILTNASREGARRGIVFREDVDHNRLYSGENIENAVKQYIYNDYPENNNLRLITFGIDNLTITPNSSDGEVSIAQGDYITVEVNYDYDFLLLPFLPSASGISRTLSLAGKTTMRAE